VGSLNGGKPNGGAAGDGFVAGGRRPRVELPAGTLFVGDLHVDVDRPEELEQFEALLLELGRAPAAVFVGDVFEYWIGPSQGETEGGRRALLALRRAADRGTALHVVPGNRDFLLDAGFERASGARLWPRGFCASLGADRELLVLHGDELCTLDVNYLRLRRVLRSRALLWLAPRLPRGIARAIAARLRRASRRALAHKPRAEAEQQEDAARQMARAEGAEVLLCGHAHRFRDQLLAGGPRWIVLDAWRHGKDLVRLGAGGELEAFSSGAIGGANSGGAAAIL